MTAEELTITRARTLGAIIEATHAGQRITWMPNGDLDAERPIEGTLRTFSEQDGPGRSSTWAAGDVRDKYVHISATFEHWIKVDDLANWIESRAAFLK